MKSLYEEVWPKWMKLQVDKGEEYLFTLSANMKNIKRASNEMNIYQALNKPKHCYFHTQVTSKTL